MGRRPTEYRARRSPLGLRLALAFAAVLTLSCAASSARPDGPPEPSPDATPTDDVGALTESAAAAAVSPASTENVHALVINGGAKASANHWSHVEHVDGMVDAFLDRGVAPERVHVFASDGNDPEGDVSKRRPRDVVEHGWFLDATRLGWQLRPRTRLDSTPWPELLPHGIGERVAPATTVELERWFDEVGGKLESGDTLLVYTTDHGIEGKFSLDNGALALWGEELDVNQMRALLGSLPSGVRVVLVMSQCFSGTFASAVLPAEDTGWDDTGRDDSDGARASGEACGMFSVPRDRPAYGCFPEGAAGGEMGHGYAFIDGMRSHSSLSDVHDFTLRHDDTPDVPVRTSEILVARTLDRLAGDLETTRDEWLDPVLARSWDDADGPTGDPAWAQVALIASDHGIDLDTIGRSLAGLATAEAELYEMRKELRGIGSHWNDAVGPIADAKLEDFVAANPDWLDRLDTTELDGLDDSELAARRSELAADLGSWMSSSDPELFDDLEVLRERSEQANDAAWRTALRIGGIARIRYALLGIAARHLLREAPDDAALNDLASQVAALSACESFTPGEAPGANEVLAAPVPLPSGEEDRALRGFLEPVRLGVSFSPAEGVGDGAARIERVVSGSVAEAAGMRRGDVVLGPADAPFAHRMDLKRWVLTAPLDEPLSLDVKRGSRTITLTVGPFRQPLP